ncbi:hypothetical protein LTR47_007256 [Exophiala xenobiotica]|nr:hypothetical protein LTR47_007256 [Exophiala xenobiotica]KAK5254066.1 hypothetical protein LTS06_001553 [Exophiala xenobiotica]KAK5256142.1 hypothetical protein LTR40_010580 [Exophiala xenobiotica]KAK5352026.1 hypothetical protein LTR61_004276 [Exophiala xenobiotica]KAK5371528.1 hypothetical protein LTR11_006555 [Exophiala xenobiotica]
MQQKARAGLLAALESSSNSSMIMPFPSQPAAATGGRLSLSLSQNAVSSNNSRPASSPASASRSVLDVSRPDSQVLPATQTTPLVIVPPPPAVVHIYERTRQSPDPSLDTIHEHEEPHPGRRVSFGHRARSRSCSRSRAAGSDSEADTSISPLSLSELGVEDDDDDDQSPIDDDVQGHTGQANKYRTSNMNKNQEIPYNNGQSGSSKSKSSIFGRNFGRDQASTKTRKLSFSFPLRRLHKDKDKAKEDGRTKTRA